MPKSLVIKIGSILGPIGDSNIGYMVVSTELHTPKPIDDRCKENKIVVDVESKSIIQLSSNSIVLLLQLSLGHQIFHRWAINHVVDFVIVQVN